MATISREEALQFLDDVRLENGYMSEEELNTLSSRSKRSYLSLKTKYGAGIRTLVDSVFSNDTRFVYELIQNAEDNNYPTLPNVSKFLRFIISANSIIIESNESGFTKDNVKALCSSGQSSKVTQGYIGQKGIGFKSVFRVASRVQVQSGPFSFAFKYTRELDPLGIGMVTPLDSDFQTLAAGVTTRIELTLIESVVENRDRYSDLFDMPDTILMFLTKLDEIQVVDQTSSDKTFVKTYPSFQSITNSSLDIMQRVSLPPSTVGAFNVSFFKNDTFYSVASVVTGLPPDPNRPDSLRGRVEVVYPADWLSYEPSLRPRHVCAYLPLGKVGFKFLIHGDFVTQASREGVIDCPRNVKLRHAVAEAFCEGIEKFCRHPTLAYTWMKWLPDEGSIHDTFWAILRREIMEILAWKAIALTWTGGTPNKTKDLQYLRQDYLDAAGMPLFRDLADEEIYLSNRYDSRGVGILKELGLRDITAAQIVKRLDADLCQTSSKMKTTPSEDDWHTKVAELLRRFFDNGALNHEREQLRGMKMIPLTSGLWASAGNSSIYFPETKGSSIPRDLGLKLVSPSATKNTARTLLFQKLGVAEISPQKVIDMIYLLHSSSPSVRPDTCHFHLKFLFETIAKPDHEIAAKMRLLTAEGKIYRASRPRWYLQQPEERYGPGKLLGAPSDPSNLLLHQGIQFLHPKYLQQFGVIVRRGTSFQSWLETVLSIQIIPQLVHMEGDKLSAEFRHIFVYHLPELLGLLRKHWPKYERVLQQYPNTLRELKNIKVLDPYSININSSQPLLSEFYLPLPRLQNIVSAAGVSGDSIFLPTSQDVRDDDLQHWQFLRTLGIGLHDDVQFYLRLLKLLSSLSQKPSPEQVAVVYSKLAENCVTENDRKHVRTFFAGNSSIYVASEWTTAEKCIWKGPDWLRHKPQLQEHYHDLEQFFCITIGIRNVVWQDALNELDDLAAKQQCTIEQATSVYSWLYREFYQASKFGKIRRQFEDRECIFVPSKNVWCSSSLCIWAEDKISFPQKHFIASHYPSLKNFFTKVLGIARPDLGMYVESLRSLAMKRDEPGTVRQLKDIMSLITAMSPAVDDLKPLRKSAIFPVRIPTGKVSRTNSGTEFAIIDKKEYIGRFSAINVLDFSLIEVSRYGPFLLAMGLDKKFMSGLVHEKTDVKEGTAHVERTQYLRSRAPALFRCAKHYHSSKAREGNLSLFSQLKDVEVLISDDITRSLSIVQNGEEHRTDEQKANIHIQEESGVLRLYIPRDKHNREVCHLRQLPRHLLRFLRISNTSAEAVISGVVNSSSIGVTNEILEDAGVPGLELPSDIQETNEEAEDDEIDEELEVVTTAFASATLTRRELPNQIVTAPVQTRERLEIVPTFDRSQTVPPSFDQVTSDTSYVNLLEHVVDAARDIAFPEYGTVSQSASSHSDRRAMFGYRSLERDRKVGAAGELFIFEVLSHLSLSDFTTTNWKSTIRHAVRGHQKYCSLSAFTGRETSDIVYDDIDGQFTAILHRKGYLPGTAGVPFEAITEKYFTTNGMVAYQSTSCQTAYEKWSYDELRLQDYGQKRRYGTGSDGLGFYPRYYIEVKTTTSGWDESLYMSKAQYSRMQTYSHRTKASDPFYLLARVFQLEGRIGLRVYLDPVGAAERGELVFTPESWIVKPKRSEEVTPGHDRVEPPPSQDCRVS